MKSSDVGPPPARSARAREDQSKGATPEPGFESPPDPAATNRDHPTAPGQTKTIPGAGIVHPTRPTKPRRR